LQQVFEGDHLRIVGDLDHLGVAGVARADLAVRWVGHPPASIARLDLLHTLQLIIHCLKAPEAAARKRCDLLAIGRMHRCVLFLAHLFSSFCSIYTIRLPKYTRSAFGRHCANRSLELSRGSPKRYSELLDRDV